MVVLQADSRHPDGDAEPARGPRHRFQRAAAVRIRGVSGASLTRIERHFRDVDHTEPNFSPAG